MRLQYIKLTIITVWVLAAIFFGVAADVTSAGGRLGLTVLTLLPCFALWRLWNDPPQTLSQSIQRARR
jgi:hypothetical protein